MGGVTMKKLAIRVGIIIGLIAVPLLYLAFAQSVNINIGGFFIRSGTAAVPASCSGLGFYFKTSATRSFNWCNNGTFTNVGTGGGTVTSVSGTTNQIDSTGGTTPVLSLSSTLVAPGSIGSVGALTTYNGITTAGLGFPVQVARVRAVSQVAAIGTTTLLATGAATADYLVVGTVYCDTTSAVATVSITIGYTDSGSQAQTISPTAAACTTLGSSSFALINSPIVAKNGTNITYATSIANTPTYDLRLDLYQLGSN